MGNAMLGFTTLGNAGLMLAIAAKIPVLESGAWIQMFTVDGTTAMIPSLCSLKIATSRNPRDWEMGNATKRRTTAPNATMMAGIAAMRVVLGTRVGWRHHLTVRTQPFFHSKNAQWSILSTLAMDGVMSTCTTPLCAILTEGTAARELARGFFAGQMVGPIA